MSSALDASRSGMLRHQAFIDTVANNLANVNTTGYKRQKAYFQDVLTTEDFLRLVAATDADAVLATTAGVELSGIERIFSPGALALTGNPLDVAIAGEGFFQVLLPDGTVAYTRDGTFTRDADGRVVTANGHLLLGQAGPITLPANAARVSVGQDGAVVVELDDGSPPFTLATIQLARFINPEGLLSAGQNLLLASENSGPPVLGQPGANGFGRTVGGAVELSNVDVGEELTNMILAQRGFQFNLRAYQTTEEMLRQANDMNR
ncbi:MAG TPA: flagellar hook-basal body complex protein [Dehalococcoidia bacterium]